MRRFHSTGLGLRHARAASRTQRAGFHRGLTVFATFALAIGGVLTTMVAGPLAPAQAAGTANLALSVQQQGKNVPSSDFIITATGSGAAAGTVIAGPANLASQNVPAGTYTLTITPADGYRLLNWQCDGLSSGWGTNTVTFAENAAVSCRAVMQYQDGRLRIWKALSIPSGLNLNDVLAVDQNNAAFNVTYNCGPGFENVASTVNGNNSREIGGVPHGRTCTVIEQTPNPALLKPGFTGSSPCWGGVWVSAR